MLASHGLVALLLTVAAPNVTAPGTAADEQLRAQAREAARAGQHARAAGDFESLWWQRKAPADLFDAASARFAAGHHAHAAAHLVLLLEQPELTLARRSEAESLLWATRRHLVPVTLDVWRVDETSAPDATISALYVDTWYRPLLPLTLAGPGRRQTQVIELDPGGWQLFPGTSMRPVDLRVRAGQPLRVRLDVPPEDDPRRRHKFSGVVAAHGIPGLLIGSLLTAFGSRGLGPRRRLADACDADHGVDPPTSCGADSTRHLVLTGSGGGVLGWSAGMITGGLLGLLPDHRRRRTAWFSTLALGGGALIGGAVLTSVGAHRYNEPSGDPTAQHAASRGANLYLAGTPIVGLGAGLLMSSIAGIAAEYCHGFSHGKLQRCAALRGSIRPDAAALTITGAF